MADEKHIQYFLGANSPSGFYSLYDHLLPPERANRFYILKGGPGCGKSTLMRQVARRAEEAGEAVEYILCSGDPDSLDAILLPRLGVAIVDGTAPHVVEPKYPGAVEEYVNLGRAYQREGLQEVKGELMSCMTGYKACYQRAYRCLGAAAAIQEDLRATLTTPALEERLAKRAKGILSRELKARPALPGQVKQRFLGAVTHKGIMTLYDTALIQCPKVYELHDRCGLAHGLLTHLLSGAVAKGYDVVACPDPMAPQRLAHLLIPQAGLAFLSVIPGQSPAEKPWRRVRIETGVGGDLMRRSRPRIRFAQKVGEALMEEAVASLAQAKSMHDDLEAIYHPYVDFSLVDRTAQDLAQTILEK